MNKTFADFLQEKAKELDPTGRHFIYSTTPYSCGLTEAMIHSKRYAYPEKERVIIGKEHHSLRISIKPLKGSGKRKLYTFMLWY